MNAVTSSTPSVETRSWKEILHQEREQPYFKEILAYIERERRAGKTIYPPNAQIFNALTLTPFSEVRVVILGQDPYHGPGQAHGLCFSVQQGVPPPPSLQNIFKELAADIGMTPPKHGDLTAWATQGVLLLNTSLSVEAGKPLSHAGIGWERFTDAVITSLNQSSRRVVFLLWGSHAQKKQQLIDRSKHCILTAPHPSPLSAHRGFLGCKHFSKANALLVEAGEPGINWGAIASG